MVPGRLTVVIGSDSVGSPRASADAPGGKRHNIDRPLVVFSLNKPLVVVVVVVVVVVAVVVVCLLSSRERGSSVLQTVTGGSLSVKC